MKTYKQRFPIQLDPRTKMLFILISNCPLFLQSNVETIYIYIAIFALMFAVSGCYKSLATFSILSIVLISLLYCIFPIAPETIVMLLSISVNYTFKMLPCLMAGTLLIKTTSLHDVVLAMRKCHFPQRLIISLSVTIRYFPAIREEVRNIRNAMKLRVIPFSEKAECFIVPIMMSASNTVEELSAAAVTRGIENPAKKTSIVQLRFELTDFIAFFVCIDLVVLSFVFR